MALSTWDLGGTGLRITRGGGELAQDMIEEGSGGPEGPPPSVPESLGVRRVYRVGGSVFKAWVNRLESGAEYLKEGQWVWTPIPSSNIMDHPSAIELGEEELAALLAGPPAKPAPAAARGVRR
jgi:hypothetical protein